MTTESWLSVIGALNLVWLSAAWFARRSVMEVAEEAVRHVVIIERRRWGMLMDHHDKKHDTSDGAWEGLVDDAEIIVKEGWPEGWDKRIGIA